MIRTLTWIAAGVLLGAVIHIVIILILPSFAEETAWSKVSALRAINKLVLLPAVEAGAANPLGLDPELTYAVCQVDLSTAPAVLSGTLPDAHWSLAIYDPSGAVVYSTTNRDGIGQVLDLGIFNPRQTRLLAEQQIDISEGLLIVESPTDQLFVVLRLAPPHPSMRARFEEALGKLACGNIRL